ncbi:MAG: ferritin-like domain-containing protein [candidate division NC10 bacterium]|nr:ferritin-like domain-containing protein [candidate division NC10 bacterium]
MMVMENTALIDLLNRLLEAERSGVRAVSGMLKSLPDGELKEGLKKAKGDEARYVAGLHATLKRLGAVPSEKVGDFADKLLAIDGIVERLRFLNRGQGWVLRKIEALLPTLTDHAMRDFFSEMLDTHRKNIAWAEKMIEQMTAKVG